MDSHPLGLPDAGSITPTTLIHLRNAIPTTTATQAAVAATPSSTIAPYTTGLSGVNQPNNMLFTHLLWWTLGIAGLSMLLIRIAELAWAKLRLVMAMSQSREKQVYWKVTQWDWMPSLKRNLIYAPLGKKRHNREIRLSKAGHMGTLPSRLHALLLLGYLASNLVYMFILDWKNSNRYALCAELRGRSGTLALVSMVPLIIFAGRNNPLIRLLNVSFDTYNLLHRWMGRVAVIEIIIHFIAWAVAQVADDGWAGVSQKILHDSFITSGTVGAVAMVVILILALSPVRHAFYETFLNTHIILALIVFLCTWVHCLTANVAGGLPQTPWIMAILALWLAERSARMFRLAYANWSSRGFSEAIVEPMPGEACRVTMHLPRFVDVKPGQHAYLRFAGVHPWESHPFSIAWFEHTYASDAVLPLTEKEGHHSGKPAGTGDRCPVGTTVSFVIGAHTGFTRKLYNKTISNNRNITQDSSTRRSGSQAPISLRAAFEGPYAGHHSMDSYGHAVLFAGATGITHQVSYLRHLIAGYGAGTAATRRVTLVWIVRDYEVLEWVRPFMDSILRMADRKAVLRIKLFVTRPKAAGQVASSSNTVQMFPGRPNVPMLLAKEVSEQVGAMCVSVCGPGGLADDVRDAVRKVQGQRTVVDFVEESFTW